MLLLNKAKLGYWFIGQPDTLIGCLAIFLAAACGREPRLLSARDTFLCGALVAALARRRSWPEALRRASAAAALACTRAGAQSSIPTQAEVDRLVEGA